MFDILLGRKFSNKCKHSVKYIKCRIETIRKKKQVMVRYLKKDVADLLAGGHDDNAFGRIDALIVEINHVSCYDMIEQYCGCFLEHLSTICKERECPKEALEAVATLIFAAARFSDLPELADLRTVFTNRYGTRMESSIDKEFVEKIQKKSFPKARKLQLMEDLAQEFSVNWNSNMFEKKMSNQSAPTHGKAMKHQLVTKEKEKPFPTTAPPEHQIQPKEQKDLQTTPTNTNQNKKYRNDSILEGNSLGRSVMVINTIPPPYTKLKVVSNGTTADHGDLAHSEASEDVKELDRNGEDRWPHRRRTFNSQPPYRKPNVNVIPNDTNYVNPQDNMPKDEIFEEDSNISSQIQTKQGRETAKANGIHGEVYDEQRFIIKQTPSSRRRHGSRRAVETTKDGGYDKEEEIMDKLLMHYSKKGTKNEPRKTRMNMRGAPIEPIANAARVPEHLDEHKRYLNTLPRELTSPAETEKPARRMPLRQPENENRVEMDRPALRNS